MIGALNICLVNDFFIPPAKRSKAKDPHQLRVNSYRVLLTRGRDRFIVFVPNEIGMRSTYEAPGRAAEHSY
ncbi:MAG: DNA/RNA helicase domain-containing protein [Deltaproteobacteria bacterium]